MIFNDYCSYGWIQDDRWNPVPLVLFDSGVEKRTQPAYYFDNRKRGNYSGYLFQYTIHGEGMWETKKEKKKLYPGCAFLTPIPHDSRYYLPPGTNNSWDFFYLHFGGYVASQIVAEILEQYGSILCFDKTPQFVMTFANEHREICNGKQYKRYEASVFLYRFLTELLAELESVQTTADSVIEKGRQWLNQNFSSPCSLSEMCEKLHVTLPHFSRQFHACYGITPHNYLTKLRLEHAMSLLLNTSLSIREIAQQSGFTESNYFTKVFRKYTHMTPGDFRKEH